MAVAYGIDGESKMNRSEISPEPDYYDIRREFLFEFRKTDCRYFAGSEKTVFGDIEARGKGLYAALYDQTRPMDGTVLQFLRRQNRTRKRVDHQGIMNLVVKPDFRFPARANIFRIPSVCEKTLTDCNTFAANRIVV